jgi:membrane-associated phospholipid phosphatase
MCQARALHSLDIVETTAERRRVSTRTVVLLVGCSFVIVAVVVFGLLISNNAAWSRWELGVLQSLSDLHTVPPSAVALSINAVFSPIGATVIVILIALLMLLLTRRRRLAVFFVAMVAIPWAGAEAIKLLVHRARPDGSLLSHMLIPTPTSFSYPSGHTTFATVICLSLLLTVGRSRWRPLFVVIAAIVPLATAFSRMYLGVHYPSDVVAALVYSVAAVTIVWLLLHDWANVQ